MGVVPIVGWVNKFLLGESEPPSKNIDGLRRDDWRDVVN